MILVPIPLNNSCSLMVPLRILLVKKKKKIIQFILHLLPPANHGIIIVFRRINIQKYRQYNFCFFNDCSHTLRYIYVKNTKTFFL